MSSDVGPAPGVVFCKINPPPSCRSRGTCCDRQKSAPSPQHCFIQSSPPCHPLGHFGPGLRDRHCGRHVKSMRCLFWEAQDLRATSGFPLPDLLFLSAPGNGLMRTEPLQSPGTISELNKASGPGLVCSTFSALCLLQCFSPERTRRGRVALHPFSAHGREKCIYAEMLGRPGPVSSSETTSYLLQHFLKRKLQPKH